MKALKHKNIVNLRQVLTSSSKLYIVMDLVTGGELFTKILNEGKLEENVARSYFQQLVDGIEYCHRRGVCHRDLKPENLLIDETTGELKITDFGLSAMKGASTTEELLHTQCGSPNYCAPEIIARHRQGYNGAKVDAWSCGIILFALLAGFLPFYDENTKVLYRMIQRDDVKFPRKFPAEAKDLVLKLLHKEPEKRYTLAEVKKHPWFVVGYSGDNSTPSNSSPPSSSQGRSRRRRGHNRTRSSDTGPRSRTGTDGSAPQTNTQPPAPPTPPQAPAPPPVPVPPQAPVPPPVPAPPRTPAPPAVPTAPKAPTPPTPPSVPAAPRAPIPPAVPAASLAPVPPSVPVPPRAPVAPAAPAPSRPPAPPAVPAPPARAPAATQPPSQLPSPPPPKTPSIPASPAPAPVQAKSAVPVPPVAPVPVIPDAPVRHPPPPVPPPAQRSAVKPSHQSAERAPPPVPPPVRHKAASPPPPIPPAPRKPLDNSTEGNTISAEFRNESLPEVGKESLFPNSSPVLAPSGSPVTSTSEVNIASSGSIPVAPKPELPMFGAPMPPTAPGKTEVQENKQKSEKSTLSHSAPRSDTSWQRRATGSTEERSTGPTLVPAGVPMSFVEQRRAMYNNLATGGPTTPAPLPDFTRASRSSSFEPDNTPKSNPLPGFRGAQRAPIARKASAPNATASLQRKFEELPMMPMQTAYSTPPLYNGIREKESIAPLATSVPATTTEPAMPSAIEPKAPPAASVTSVESVSQKPNPTAVGNGTIPVEEDEEKIKASRKQRTRAALARYRRIFRLGNNIGITGSPSFNSNHSKMVDESKSDQSPIPGRAEFFARAKAVTGAWGVILTQELEEDSDSEDEEREITDEELAAFGKLLDFWDNRRASATLSQKGEVVLDDDASTPLTDNDIQSIQSLLAKLEPKREDDVEEVADVVPPEVVENGLPVPSTPDEPKSDEIRKLLERDFSNPSVDSSGTPASPRPRSVSNMDRTSTSALKMSASVDALSARMQQQPRGTPNAKSAVGQARVMPAVPAPNRGGGVFPPPPSYAPPDGPVTPPRLTVTPSTVRDPFRPKLPPQYPSQFPGPAGQNDSFPVSGGKGQSAQLPRTGGLSNSISVDTGLHGIANRKSSNEKSERKSGSSKDLAHDTASQGSLVGKNDPNRSKHLGTPTSGDTATRGMFAFSMFSRKKAAAQSSFDAQLPLDKCLVEVGRILQGLGCSVMMKRGESKMKCEAPVRNSEKMLVSVMCTHAAGKTKVVFKKGRKDRSRVDAKEFYEFFQTVHSRFVERVQADGS